MSGAILIVGPGTHGRGGISSVIRLHQGLEALRTRRAHLLSTYDDRSVFHKIWSAARAYLFAPFLLYRADLTHVHLAAQISMLRKLPVVLCARLLGKPIIVHVHAGSETSLIARTPRWMVKYVFHSAERVIALSESWAALIRAHVPNSHVVVVPNPVELPIAVSPPAAGSDPVVLFVGRLDARKGYRDLLAAARIVLQTVPSAQFWFAGHGETREAALESERLGIKKSVRLLGWVRHTDLSSLYAQASVLVLPSYGEGLPMSVLEAMSHGVPVVTTPVGGLPEWIIDGANGLFAPPGDRAALAAQILKVLVDADLAEHLRIAGRATIEQRCSAAIVSSQLDALYEEILNAPQRPRGRRLARCPR